MLPLTLKDGKIYCAICQGEIILEDVLESDGSVLEGYTDACAGYCPNCTREYYFTVTSEPGAITLEAVELDGLF